VSVACEIDKDVGVVVVAAVFLRNLFDFFPLKLTLYVQIIFMHILVVGKKVALEFLDLDFCDFNGEPSIFLLPIFVLQKL